MVTLISKSPEQTVEFGAKLGAAAQPGDVFGLVGELGAGKTQFAKGIARGLGIEGRIHSPTFALVNEYTTGRLPCHHLDLYRLETADQILGAGLDQYLHSPPGVTIVEWYDRWTGTNLSAPLQGKLIRITGEDAHERTITYEDFGA